MWTSRWLASRFLSLDAEVEAELILSAGVAAVNPVWSALQRDRLLRLNKRPERFAGAVRSVVVAASKLPVAAAECEKQSKRQRVQRLHSIPPRQSSTNVKITL